MSRAAPASRVRQSPRGMAAGMLLIVADARGRPPMATAEQVAAAFAAVAAERRRWPSGCAQAGRDHGGRHHRDRGADRGAIPRWWGPAVAAVQAARTPSPRSRGGRAPGRVLARRWPIAGAGRAGGRHPPGRPRAVIEQLARRRASAERRGPDRATSSWSGVRSAPADLIELAEAGLAGRFPWPAAELARGDHRPRPWAPDDHRGEPRYWARRPGSPPCLTPSPDELIDRRAGGGRPPPGRPAPCRAARRWQGPADRPARHGGRPAIALLCNVASAAETRRGLAGRRRRRRAAAYRDPFTGAWPGRPLDQHRAQLGADPGAAGGPDRHRPAARLLRRQDPAVPGRAPGRAT